MTDKYNRDYFENGIVSGTSCYVNYRWLPELTIKMAHNIIEHLGLTGLSTVLDYGCAKGYLVKALRILDIDAYGYDISEYAIRNVDTEVRDYCYLIENGKLFRDNYDWIITKDVLEHMSEEELDDFLLQSRTQTDRCFHVIPLGDGENFIVPEYELDTTHVLAKPMEWWKSRFEKAGWEVESSVYSLRGVKDNWTQKYNKGNGFFILKYGG